MEQSLRHLVCSECAEAGEDQHGGALDRLITGLERVTDGGNINAFWGLLAKTAHLIPLSQ